MAGSLNKVCLLGNVGKDPEIKSLQSGMRIANLTLATEESWKDKSSGEKKSKTEWHRIVIFNDGLVGVVENYVKKGSKLYIEGSIQTRKWTDQGGNERYSTEIVLANFSGQLILLNRPDDGRAAQAPREAAATQQRQPDRTDQRSNPQWNTPAGDLDDEIPF